MRVFTILSAALIAFAASASAASVSDWDVVDLSARSDSSSYPNYDKIRSQIKKRWEAGTRLNGTQTDPTGTEADTPGYKTIFGPSIYSSGGYDFIGYKILDSYDPDACAAECGRHNRNLGVCRAFNIFRASFKGDAVAAVCLTFDIVSRKQDFVFHQKNGFVVDWSRGYQRKQIIPDISFRKGDAEHFESTYWNSTGKADVVVDSWATSMDPDLKSYVSSQPLRTVPGREYTVLADYRSKLGSKPLSSYFAFRWNGEVFGTPFVDDPFPEERTTRVINAKTPVAKGNDILEMYGGSVGGAWRVLKIELFIV